MSSNLGFQALYEIATMPPNELNDGTYQHLGMRVLSEIATMPPDERDKPQQLSSGEVNTHSSVFQILGKLKFIEIIKRGVHFRHPLDT